MSDSERPESTAFRDLEQLVRHLGDELASFRRRALQAEARVRELEGAPAGQARGGGAADLDAENERLRKQIAAASTRTRQMLDRMRFLRQQHDRGSER